MSQSAEQPYIFRLDAQDRVVRLSSNWLAFADENEGGERCHPEKIVNRPIWDFVAGKETRHLYELVFEKVRSTLRPATVEFRCDAPARRRFCHLAIIPLLERGLELFSQVERIEERDRVALLDPRVARSSEVIRICSLCKRIALPDDRWVEVEEAIRTLNLFGKPRPPQISHVTCPDCSRAVLGELEQL